MSPCKIFMSLLIYVTIPHVCVYLIILLYSLCSLVCAKAQGKSHKRPLCTKPWFGSWCFCRIWCFFFHCFNGLKWNYLKYIFRRKGIRFKTLSHVSIVVHILLSAWAQPGMDPCLSDILFTQAFWQALVWPWIILCSPLPPGRHNHTCLILSNLSFTPANQLPRCALFLHLLSCDPVLFSLTLPPYPESPLFLHLYLVVLSPLSWQ